MAGTSLSLSHTYEDVMTSRPDIQTDGTTPWNKLNLLAQTELPWGFNVAGQLNWTGEHWVYRASNGVKELHTDQSVINLRLGYRPNADLELYAVADNVDHAYRSEGADGATQAQVYWAGATYSFGGK
jgi:outer membrane receptor protein involved in Fe transport